jgi:hypothetical protein
VFRTIANARTKTKSRGRAIVRVSVGLCLGLVYGLCKG